MSLTVFYICYVFALNDSLCCNVLLYDDNPGTTDGNMSLVTKCRSVTCVKCPIDFMGADRLIGLFLNFCKIP